jgi:hypothetical protein
MNKPSLTIFANFHINNAERLQRMKDSLDSFLKINPNQYVINIRGKFKHKAGKFLQKRLDKKLEVSYFNNKRGWFYDSRYISKKITSKYIFFWLEDHLLISTPKIFKNCLMEMDKYKADQLQYSLLHNQMRKTWAILPSYKVGKYLTIFNLNSDGCLKMKNKLKRYFYAISCEQIFEKNFFLKVHFSKKPFLKRWPRHLPFDFEKKSADKISSDIRFALPHNELFAAIDDDHANPGYSLISRKKYPNRISRSDFKKLEFGTTKQSCILWNCNKFIHLLKNNRFLKNYINNTLYFIKRVFYTINLYGNKK